MKTGRGGSGRELNELEIVHRFAVDMLQSNNLLWSIVENVGRLLEFEDFALYLCEGDRLYQRAVHDINKSAVHTIINPVDRVLAGRLGNSYLPLHRQRHA